MEIDKPIGFFDSGVGGISVLKEAIRQMPNEDFIYYGDSKNAPYGTKNLQQVRELTFNAVEYLIERQIKALVIACNTATSAAINEIREKYSSIPVIGIEPALKPAVLLKEKGKILIMATSMTLSEKKFKELMRNFENQAEMITLACPGLVELIEKGNLNSEELNQYFNSIFSSIKKEEIGAVVLGCTHYPFIKNNIKKTFGDIPIIDGAKGTATYLRTRLEDKNLVNNSDRIGTVEIINSLNSEEIISLSKRLLDL